MSWPDYIRDMFDAIPGGPNDASDESLFYGPYCNLLLYLFPPTEKYMITPQFKRPPEGRSINFATVFVVQKAFHPVFFLEVKPPGHYALRSTRAAADDQMRNRFFDLADVVELPVIHGVSALGTRLCFYEYTRNNDLLKPSRIPPNDNHMNDVAPAARWKYDVLSEEGVAKMTQVANEVKAMVGQHAWLFILATLLGHGLTTKQTLTRALSIYDHIRRPFALQVQERSRLNGRYFTLSTPEIDFDAVPEHELLPKLNILAQIFTKNWEWSWSTSLATSAKEAVRLLESSS